MCANDRLSNYGSYLEIACKDAGVTAEAMPISHPNLTFAERGMIYFSS